MFDKVLDKGVAIELKLLLHVLNDLLVNTKKNLSINKVGNRFIWNVVQKL